METEQQSTKHPADLREGDTIVVDGATITVQHMEGPTARDDRYVVCGVRFDPFEQDVLLFYYPEDDVRESLGQAARRA